MIQRTAKLLAIGLALLLGAANARADDRPNIVLAIADDWSWPHAGVYGDEVVKTPTFDRLAGEGILFTRAFCASPSCTPSRGAILTGQAVHRLKDGGNLWSKLPKSFLCYTDLLEEAGYFVGMTGKGWSPGTLEGSGRKHNPAGAIFKDFDAFLKSVPKGKPFAYWYGSQDPHRPYEAGSGARAGLQSKNVQVPGYLPDTPEIRSDILDYYLEVQRFDQALGEIVRALDDGGYARNTMLAVTSDNGMPFPRCKANLYDSGTHVPLLIRWPIRYPLEGRIESFVTLADLAPTFLEAAKIPPPAAMTGNSLAALMFPAQTKTESHNAVFLERERHANVRAGNLSYPSRSIRTERYQYIRNLRPDRWPAGDPVLVHSVGPFGDVDDSPTKQLLLGRREESKLAPFFQMSFGKRPAEELYDMEKDPFQLKNIADDPALKDAKAVLRIRLERWMRETGDPLADEPDSHSRDPFDEYPYVGPAFKNERP